MSGAEYEVEKEIGALWRALYYVAEEEPVVLGEATTRNEAMAIAARHKAESPQPEPESSESESSESSESESKSPEAETSAGAAMVGSILADAESMRERGLGSWASVRGSQTRWQWQRADHLYQVWLTDAKRWCIRHKLAKAKRWKEILYAYPNYEQAKEAAEEHARQAVEEG
jgi:hypothetical protein